MIKKSFANRLILNFTFVIFGGFLAVYFLFNSLMTGYIRAEAAAELDREIMTIEETEIISNVSISEGLEIFFTPMRGTRTILNVDTIIVDHTGMILLPNQLEPPSDNEEIIRIESLVYFWSNNQNLFEESDDMIMISHAGHTFYMRATPHYIVPTGPLFFEPVPITVLMYTDITPVMNLKNSMNQILLILLATSGIATLGSSILLSKRFKKSIKRLCKHAEVIGLGNFNELVDGFNYLEFNHLASSMNNMANMLGMYEATQKQFFQNASHELRTPLMSIRGYAEGLKSGVFINDDATDIILEESKKMTELINDILYLSKLNASANSQLNLSPICINTLITNATDRVRIIAEKANKQIITDPSSATQINTDKSKLERAIINILSNAIRYAKSEIHINYLVENNQLNIMIANDGAPIDEKDLPHIFDRFYKGRSGNTGLGLAITRDIVTRLGGIIEAKNLESGVKFVIILPL